MGSRDINSLQQFWITESVDIVCKLHLTEILKIFYEQIYYLSE